MITVRPAKARGVADFGWLDSRHTFSFGQYYDPNHMGFASLRVINEDKVQPGKGFGTHGHRDMEIISYVLDGALEHRDSIGTGSTIRPGDVQRMSAGTGILHSEFNASNIDPVHFLQIWILPNQRNLQPSYEQKHFTPAEKQGKLKLVGSSDGRDGSVTIHQDVDLYVSSLQPKEEVNYQILDGRSVWLQVTQGAIAINGTPLYAGDGAAVTNQAEVAIKGIADSSEVLLFDLA